MFDLLRNYNHVPWLDDKTLATDASNRQYQPSEVLAKIIEEDADWISFTMWNVGIKHMTLKDKP